MSLGAFVSFNASGATVSGNLSYEGAQTGDIKVRVARYRPGNQALRLDGTGDYVVTPLNNLAGAELSVQFWFKGNSMQSVVRQQSSGWVVVGWNGQHILSNDGGTAGVTAGTGFDDGNWHHIMITWKQGTPGGFVSYLDGRVVGQRDSANTPIPSLNASVYFGAFNGQGEFTSGQVDEIAIWNRALTSEEVSAGWNQPLTGVETGLVGYWPFDDGTANDLSANAYHGTLGGDAAIVPANIPGFGGGLYATTIAAPGPFSVPEVALGDNYFINAFRDANNSGNPDLTEPFGDYAGNPVTISGDLSGVNIRLIEVPLIITQPAALRVLAGSPATFRVTVTGTAPLQYQWRKDGTNLPANPRLTGVNSAQLTIAGTIADDAGLYSVEITNEAGRTVSQGAELQVATGGANLAGTVSYSGSRTGQVVVTVFQPKLGNRVLRLDGVNDFASTPLNDLSGSEITIQYWFRGSVLQSAVRQQGGGGYIVASWNGKHIMSHDGGTTGIAQGSATDGLWHHLAYTWKQGTPNGWVSYLDGRQVAAKDSVNIPIPKINGSVLFGSFGGNGEFARGDLDEIAIWRRALTATEIASSFRLGLTGSEPDLIGYWSFDDGTANDASLNQYHGTLNNGAQIVDLDNTELGQRVAASINGPGAYLLQSVPVGPGYFLNAFLDANSNGRRDNDEPFGNYPSNPIDVDPGLPGTGLDIVLYDPPVVTDAPVSAAACEGATLVLKVNATGTPPLNYQWSLHGTPLTDAGTISGAQTPALRLDGVLPADAGRYEVTVSNGAGTAAHVVFLQVSSGAVADGLTGYWKFDEQFGATAVDSSPFGNNGTLANYPGGDDSHWAAGMVGGALSFGGSTTMQHVVVADFPKAITTLSGSAWVWADSRPIWASIVKNWGGSQVGQFHFGLQENSGDLSLYVTDTNGLTVSTRENVPLPLGSWQHVAFVADGLRVRIFRNGALVGSAVNYSGSFLSPPMAALGIGVKLDNSGTQPDPGNPGFWHGKMDEVALWGRALSPVEIRAIYEAGLAGQDLTRAAAQPPLQVERRGSQLAVSWPPTVACFVLESTASIAPADWKPVTATPVLEAGRYTVTLPNPSGPQFYRLRKG
jgi:hypothetical protein